MSQSARILVLEDSLLVAMELEAALLDRGFTVVTAGSLSSAWLALSDAPFHAALLDLRLPDGLSDELARELVGLGCPVALTSGDSGEDIPADLAALQRFRKPAGTDKMIGWIESQFFPDDIPAK